MVFPEPTKLPVFANPVDYILGSLPTIIYSSIETTITLVKIHCSNRVEIHSQHLIPPKDLLQHHILAILYLAPMIYHMHNSNFAHPTQSAGCSFPCKFLANQQSLLLIPLFHCLFHLKLTSKLTLPHS